MATSPNQQRQQPPKKASIKPAHIVQDVELEEELLPPPIAEPVVPTPPVVENVPLLQPIKDVTSHDPYIHIPEAEFAYWIKLLDLSSDPLVDIEEAKALSTMLFNRMDSFSC